MGIICIGIFVGIIMFMIDKVRNKELNVLGMIGSGIWGFCSLLLVISCLLAKSIVVDLMERHDYITQTDADYYVIKTYNEDLMELRGSLRLGALSLYYFEKDNILELEYLE